MFHDLALKAVISHIETHLEDDLSAEQLAHIAGYDDGYFRRFFKEGTGMGPARYVRFRRISHAAFLLRNTSRTVTDIGASSGFASGDAFSRAFRQMTGATPRAFRKSKHIVKGVYIIPGLMAPVLTDMEEFGMNTNQGTNPEKTMSSDSSTLLFGVPKVSYFNNPPELTPFLSSLRACLTWSGQAIGYGKLMVGSGAAFRLLWNTSFLDGGNVDILAMRPDTFEPIRRAFETAGRTYRHIPKSDESNNRNAMAGLIREEIDAGRPVIAFGIVGPPEACVLTGYEEKGDVVLGWNFFQDFPEWQGSITKHASGYFIRRGWYEHPETLGVLAVGAPGPEPEDAAFLKDTVRFALTVMNGPAVGERANGAPAFDAWEAMLRDDAQFPDKAPLPMLMERTMVQGDAFTMVAEGRAYAGGFFLEQANLFPQHRDLLMEISGLCKREHETAHEMTRHTGGLGIGEQQARTLARPENRNAVANLVRKCRDLDRRIAGKLETLAVIL